MSESQCQQTWLTTDEAAIYLRVSRRTIYSLVAAGRLRAYLVGNERGRRFRRSDLDAALRPAPIEVTDDTSDAAREEAESDGDEQRPTRRQQQ